MTLQMGTGGRTIGWTIGRQEADVLARFVEGLVESAFGIAHAALHAPARGAAEVAFARQVAIYLAHVRWGSAIRRPAASSAATARRPPMPAA